VSLIEHNDLAWLEPDQLLTIDWAPADIKVIDNYLKYLEVRVK